MESMPKIVSILNKYVEGYYDGESHEYFLHDVNACLATEDRKEVYESIASGLWGKYSVVDVEIGMLILRRWLSIEPDSVEAKRNLGAYLQFHGPDWDDEAEKLINEVKKSWGKNTSIQGQDSGSGCNDIQ